MQESSEIRFRVNGYSCKGLLFIPAKWRTPQRLPTVLVIPGGSGLQSTPEDFGLIKLAETMAHNGFASFCFDGRGQGESGGRRTGHDLAVSDLKSVLKVLRSRCDAVDVERIGLFGQSVGGMAAIAVATEDSGVASLVLWGTLPRYSVLKRPGDERGEIVFKKVLENNTGRRPFGKKQTFREFVRSFKVIDPIKYIGKVTQPILLAGGEKDELLFRRDEQRELHRAAKKSLKKEVLPIKGLGHRMNHLAPYFPLATKQFSNWFSATL